MEPPQTARLACIGITLVACAVGCTADASTQPSIAASPVVRPPGGVAVTSSPAPSQGTQTVPVPGFTPPPSVALDGAMSAGPPQTDVGRAMPLPCAVTSVVRERCASCHGAVPIGGAPMSLLTYEDFHKPALTRPELKVYELSRKRIADATQPMPPSAQLPASELTLLDGWLAGGAIAGEAADENCSAELDPPGTTTPREDPRMGLVPLEGETCYEFPNHQEQVEGDTTPYVVRSGEHYEQFFFKAPWPEGVVASRFGGRFDNVSVLHHWLLLTSVRPLTMAGTREDSIGTQLGEGGQLVAGWAVGGNSFIAPPDVGLELPKPGTLVHTQWHFFNRGAETHDSSVVQVCTVPASSRKKLASTIWLGSEDINLRAGAKQEVSGSCTNNSKQPVSIVAFWPHMHTRGRRSHTVVQRGSGMLETTFDQPFVFDHQYYYSLSPQMVLQQGDTITTTCSFENDTDSTIYFGESSGTEMCYILTIAYPAHALENGAWTLSGVKNICL